MSENFTDPKSSHARAVCRGVSDLTTPIKYQRLPGEECDMEQELYICTFGKRKCFYGRCLGYSDLDTFTCNQHEDCNPKFYCDLKSEKPTCKPYLQLGSACFYHEECGRKMLCYKDKINASIDYEGKCTNFFTLEEETLIDLHDNNYF